MNKYLLTLFSLFLLNSSKLSAQEQINIQFEENKGYTVESEFMCRPVDNNSNCTGEKQYYLCRNTKFVVKKIENDVVTIRVLNGGKCHAPDYAEENRLYCISRSEANLHVKEGKVKIGIDFGALSVPFKFDPATFKVYPGGNISGYIGPSILFPKTKDFHITPSLFGGFSPIPLNNITPSNSSDIKTVTGLTYGVGLIFNLKGNFQLGLVHGWDNYNVDDQKKQQKWLSISIGYQFLKRN